MKKVFLARAKNPAVSLSYTFMPTFHISILNEEHFFISSLRITTIFLRNDPDLSARNSKTDARLSNHNVWELSSYVKKSLRLARKFTS